MDDNRQSILISLINQYKRTEYWDYLDYFKQQTNFYVCISKAVHGYIDNNYTRHPHQIYYLNKKRSRIKTMERVAKLLPEAEYNNKIFSNCNTFHDIICEIEKQLRIHEIKDFGNLCIYDTSLRIGAKLGLEPKYVYLHAGTKDGAEKLLSSNFINRVSKKTKRGHTYLSLDVFPDNVKELGASDIENFLCINKDLLPRLSN